MRDFQTSTPTAAPPLFSTARGDLIDQIGVRMTFAREEEIYAQEEETDLVYRVVSGAVRTSCLLADGRRHVGAFYFAGEFFGMESGDLHRFSAEALCDTVVQVMKRSVAERDTQIERLLWTSTAHELARTHEHLLLLSRKTACEKVASFLKDMAQRQGGAETIFLPMGRQDIADYLGLTIETVSRMFSHLQAERVIELEDTRHVRICTRGALVRCCE